MARIESSILGFFFIGIFSVGMMDKLFCVVTFNPFW